MFILASHCCIKGGLSCVIRDNLDDVVVVGKPLTSKKMKSRRKSFMNMSEKIIFKQFPFLSACVYSTKSFPTFYFSVQFAGKHMYVPMLSF